MKNLVFTLAILLIISCNTKKEEAAPEERAIGFNTFLPELQWHLGTEDAITVVKDFDKLWSKRDYESMTGYFADTAKFYFPDGRVATSPAAFIDIISEDDDTTTYSWTFDYAYSVDLDPSKGGEHVQAGFTGTAIKDSVTTKKRYHESYYIIQGKIVTWNQFDMDVKEE